MNDMCASHGLHCWRMQHYKSGFEEVTLSCVHDFRIQAQADSYHDQDQDQGKGKGKDKDKDNDNDMAMAMTRASFTCTTRDQVWRLQN
jgi:hypothetical protein